MRKRYVQVDGDLIEVTPDFRQERPATEAHNIIPDIAEYQSMATGEMIGGRRQHREHLRQHGLVEIGNETDKLKAWGSRPNRVDWREAVQREMAKRGLQ